MVLYGKIAVLAVSVIALTLDPCRAIHKGREARENAHPWLVLIRDKETQDVLCTGVLVHTQFVLTIEKFCVTDRTPDRLSMLVGEKTVGATEKFQYDQLTNDIIQDNLVLLKLDEEIVENESAMVIEMAGPGDADSLIDQENICHVSGWGEKRNGKVNKKARVVKGTIWSNAACINRILRADALCFHTENGGMCERDPGSPVVCRLNRKRVLVGVHVHGTCASKGIQISAEVGHPLLKSWIEKIIHNKTVSGCGAAGRSFVFAFMRLYPPVDTVLAFYVQSVAGKTNITINVPAEGLVSTFYSGDKLFWVAPYLDDSGVEVKATSDVIITTYNILPDPKYPMMGGTVIHPESCAGTEYVVVSSKHTGNKRARHQILVQALSDDTEVTITDAAGTAVLTGQKLDRYKYHLYEDSTDVTGLFVTATAPVVVLSGHGCASVPNERNGLHCDFIVEQLPPITALSYMYVLKSLSPKNGFSYRILAAYDNTFVKMTSTLGHAPFFTINKGDISNYFTEYLNSATFIRASKPILVAQFGHDFSFDGAEDKKIGDPSMYIPTGLDKLESEYWLTFPYEELERWALVYIDQTFGFDGILLNGEPVNTTGSITAGIFFPYGIYYVVLSVPINSDVAHFSNANNYPFGVVQYGMNKRQEFAAAAGGYW